MRSRRFVVLVVPLVAVVVSGVVFGLTFGKQIGQFLSRAGGDLEACALSPASADLKLLNALHKDEISPQNKAFQFEALLHDANISSRLSQCGCVVDLPVLKVKKGEKLTVRNIGLKSHSIRTDGYGDVSLLLHRREEKVLLDGRNDFIGPLFYSCDNSNDVAGVVFITAE